METRVKKQKSIEEQIKEQQEKIILLKRKQKIEQKKKIMKKFDFLINEKESFIKIMKDNEFHEKFMRFIDNEYKNE